MGKRRRKFTARSFESMGQVFIDPEGRQRKDTSANIYESMLLSDAWHSLTDRQRSLYLIAKAQYFGKRKPQQDYKEDTVSGEENFYLPWHAVNSQYRLYRDSCQSNFRKDMQKLVERGFIEVAMSGKAHRTKTIYKYSDKWRTWKPEGKS